MISIFTFLYTTFIKSNNYLKCKSIDTKTVILKFVLRSYNLPKKAEHSLMTCDFKNLSRFIVFYSRLGGTNHEVSVYK